MRISDWSSDVCSSDLRYEHIYFWPDPRGITLRQVQGLLGQADGSMPDAAGLATQSVALQGLPALEYVLYGHAGLLAASAPQAPHTRPANAERNTRDCASTPAVAGNLRAMAGHPSPAIAAQAA